MLAIQGDTAAAVAAIEEIAAIIAQINDHQTTIASAVEEQTADHQRDGPQRHRGGDRIRPRSPEHRRGRHGGRETTARRGADPRSAAGELPDGC